MKPARIMRATASVVSIMKPIGGTSPYSSSFMSLKPGGVVGCTSTGSPCLSISCHIGANAGDILAENLVHAVEAVPAAVTGVPAHVGLEQPLAVRRPRRDVVGHEVTVLECERPADVTLPHQFSHVERRRFVMALVADHGAQPVLLRECHQFFGLSGGNTERLFAIDVFAGAQRRRREAVMMHRARRDAHDVDLGQLAQHVFDAGIGVRDAEMHRARPRRLHARRAHRDHLEEFGQRFQRRDMGTHRPAFAPVGTVRKPRTGHGDSQAARCGVHSQQTASVIGAHVITWYLPS